DSDSARIPYDLLKVVDLVRRDRDRAAINLNLDVELLLLPPQTGRVADWRCRRTLDVLAGGRGFPQFLPYGSNPLQKAVDNFRDGRLRSTLGRDIALLQGEGAE